MKHKVLLSKKEIQDRMVQLGKDITAHYEKSPKGDLIVIVVLRGAFIFGADLVREIRVPLQVDFVEASSYGNKTESSGKIELVRDFRVSIENKNVLVIEDIIDTGNTIHFLQQHLAKHKPASVKVASFLFKPARLQQKHIKADFLGFTIDDHFVIGYGLDFDNHYREIPEVVIYQP